MMPTNLSTATHGTCDAAQSEPSSVEEHSSNRVQQALQTITKFTTISEMLRMLGAVAIIGAMSIFLMMGWEVGNDIQRYFTLLAQTLLLAGGGFALSRFLKEYKGARVFFGLSLLSVTANFTILGALIYSIVQFDGSLTSYPDFASWVVSDTSNVVLTLLGAMVVLTPVSLFSFAVLARSNARWLTVAYLFANAMLLVPVRASLSSAVLSFATLIAVFYFLHKFMLKDEKSNTAEGKFAKAVLFIPSVIMIFRSWYFYDVGEMALALLMFAVYLTFRYLSSNAPKDSRRVDWLNIASVPMVGAIPYLFVLSLLDNIGAKYELLFLSALTLPFVVDLMNRLRGTVQKVVFGLLASSLILGCVLFNELMYQDAVLSLMSFTIVAGFAVYGYISGNITLTYGGIISIGLLLVINAAEFFNWLDFSKWIYLSILGVTAIVFASLLERYGPTLKLKLDARATAKALQNS